MYRVLIPSALVIVISLISRPASAQPASVVATLPVVAALVSFAVLALALYLPKLKPQDESGELVEARDFVRLASPQPIATSAGIEVAIVFAYDDPNSYYLEPLLARWARVPGRNSSHPPAGDRNNRTASFRAHLLRYARLGCRRTTTRHIVRCRAYCEMRSLRRRTSSAVLSNPRCRSPGLSQTLSFIGGAVTTAQGRGNEQGLRDGYHASAYRQWNFQDHAKNGGLTAAFTG